MTEQNAGIYAYLSKRGRTGLVSDELQPADAE